MDGYGARGDKTQIVDMAAPGARIAFLDTLRFIAALAVVLQHLLEVQHVRGFDLFIQLGPGVFGVALFFILSGFVIPFSVKRGFDPRSFAIRRICRIYPLALFAFFCAWATGQLGLPETRAAAQGSAVEWIANLLLIMDFVGAPEFHGVTWTLPIEFAWYALFAASLILFRARAGRVLEIATPVAFVLLTLLSLAAGHRLPLGRIGMIYAAVIGFQCCRHFEGRIPGRRLTIDVALFMAVMTAGNIVAFGYFRHPHITMMQAVGPWLVASTIFFIVYAVPRIRQAGWLNSPILAGLGAISFSTYLLHPFAIMFARALFGSGVAMNGAALLMTLLFSILGYALVERPGMALGRWLTPRDGGRLIVQPA